MTEIDPAQIDKEARIRLKIGQLALKYGGWEEIPVDIMATALELKGEEWRVYVNRAEAGLGILPVDKG